MNATVTIRRLRIRNIKGFESQVLPLFKRRTKELGEMLPELYLYGLANGDFEPALRGLVGEGAPLSASSIKQLKGKWQAEYADGHLGIWSALSEIHPEGDEQRCWNHKITNVLDALLKRVRAESLTKIQRYDFFHIVVAGLPVCRQAGPKSFLRRIAVKRQ